MDRLEVGDRLLIVTDGVIEAADASGKRFGSGRLTAVAERCLAEQLPASEVVRRVAHAVIDFQGGTPGTTRRC